MISRTFSNILSFFRKIAWILLIIAALLVLQTQGVFAEDPAAQTGISADDSQQLIGYLNGFLQMAAAVLGLITGFISIFLYPGWVNGTLFGLQDYLKIMWVLVSNVVYFIFAGILITIAFMNIIGKGEGTWELKAAMPKFIVGVLIVPFSWFFIQFILSVSAILTVGVLTLPYDSFQNEELFSAILEDESDDAIVNQKFCKSIVISLTGSFPEGATSVTENDGGTFPEQIKCKSKNDKVSIKEIISGEGGGAGLDNNVFGIISVYTYGILKVQERDTLVQADLTTIKGVMDLVFKVIFDLLFVVVYMILMVALFLALMSRGIHLWVYMMLSPLFGLLYFLGKGGEGFGGDSKFNIKEFIALAMVPVYVAAALAFGLTFIMVASEGIKEKSSTNDLDTLEAGGFSLSIIGAHGDGEEEKSIIAKLIVQLFGVVILWIAVTAALKSSHVTNTVTEPIQSFGKSVGELVQKSPTYMPIPGTGMFNGGEGISAASLKSIGSSINQAAVAPSQRSAQRFADQFTTPSGAEEMRRTIESSTQEEREDGRALQKALEGMGTRLFDTSNVDRRREIETINSELGLDINHSELVTPDRIAKEIRRAVGEARSQNDGRNYSQFTDIQINDLIRKLSSESTTPTTPTGATTQPTGVTSPVNPNIPTGPLTININGAEKQIDTSNITLSGNTGARTASLSGNIKTELKSVTQQALEDAGYTQEDAVAILSVL